jgi:hypothetical protein
MTELNPPNDRAPETAHAQLRTAPEPTYAPFLLALGVTMLFWGVATSPIMSIGGLFVFVWASWMWIGQIVDSWRN